MAVYHHALVLINSSQDGVPLLQHAARMAEENGMRITIATSARLPGAELCSDSLRDDRVSQEVIQARPCSTSWPAPSPCGGYPLAGDHPPV
ncbi:universal stress family protein [Klebsiella pneumoniae]|uniref:Universal stress family protein n=1 Tax=Klebsiella pneumoniae TaxID=573 RepID=A0A4P0YAW4_KLEPN|nr:universal stress family protein [Klebsiella pneumoniae]